MHRHLTIHHSKHLLTIVDVPDIGLVGPVQTHGGPGKIGDIQRAPRAVGGEIFTAPALHDGVLW